MVLDWGAPSRKSPKSYPVPASGLPDSSNALVTSPLKLYEYLAMGVPVVAPRLDPLEGIPGVRLAESREEFLACVKEVVEGEFPRKDVEVFIQDNNWQVRIDELLSYLE